MLEKSGGGGAAEESTGVGGGGVRAVFVDDSAAELLDPEVTSVPGLTKVCSVACSRE